jgi:NAD(P)-dependent dehydrogenase (short-subunit alcohol dehydrogenase family)
MATTIAGKSVLVTGTSRGIGRALVEEALRRGATRVYAAAREPVPHPDERVTPLTLDVTNPEQVRAAGASIESLDVLINNAGVQPFDDLSDPGAIEQSLAANLYGPYRVTQAFLPSVTHAHGTIVNNVSLAALAPVPFAPAYSMSKAALLSLTQSLRAHLARRGVSVHAVLSGPVDTEMIRRSRSPRPHRSRWRKRSSTVSRTEKTTSSPTRFRRRWPRAGVLVWPNSSSTRWRP